MWQHGYHYSAQVLGCGPDDQGCLLFFTATSVEDHMHDLSPHPSRKPPVMAEEPHQGMDRRGFLTSFSLTRFSEAALGAGAVSTLRAGSPGAGHPEEDTPAEATRGGPLAVRRTSGCGSSTVV